MHTNTSDKNFWYKELYCMICSRRDYEDLVGHLFQGIYSDDDGTIKVEKKLTFSTSNIFISFTIFPIFLKRQWFHYLGLLVATEESSRSMAAVILAMNPAPAAKRGGGRAVSPEESITYRHDESSLRCYRKQYFALKM